VIDRLALRYAEADGWGSLLLRCAAEAPNQEQSQLHQRYDKCRYCTAKQHEKSAIRDKVQKRRRESLKAQVSGPQNRSGVCHKTVIYGRSRNVHGGVVKK
jgi:hypothetical protein